MKTCYLVGAGDFPYSFAPKADDLVIAADGGYDSLKKNNIRCDILIGDFDSICDMPAGVELIRHPVRKDFTDMHLCYLEGRRRGYSRFEIHGGTGGREDHTFANYTLLKYIRSQGDTGILIGRVNTVRVIKNESIRLSGAAGKHFSAFALGGNAEGVSIKGLEYECESITLDTDFPLAVSNRFMGKEAEISVKRGTLLLMTEN